MRSKAQQPQLRALNTHINVCLTCSAWQACLAGTLSRVLHKRQALLSPAARLLQCAADDAAQDVAVYQVLAALWQLHKVGQRVVLQNLRACQVLCDAGPRHVGLSGVSRVL